MIFVITGTEKFPFDRFVKEIDSLKEKGIIKEEIFIQLGSCKYEPMHCLWERYLSFGDMSKNIEKSRMVIAHAGAGTTLLCLSLNKKPILVTRQKKYGEHVDNHQIPFAQNMEKLNYAIVSYEVTDLEKSIKMYQRWKSDKQKTGIYKSNLINYLNSWISTI